LRYRAPPLYVYTSSLSRLASAIGTYGVGVRPALRR